MSTYKIQNLSTTFITYGLGVGRPAISIEFQTDGGMEIALEALVANIKSLQLQPVLYAVILRGYDPMEQPIGPLVEVLLEEGNEIFIETVGEKFVENVPYQHLLVCITCKVITGMIHPKLAKVTDLFLYPIHQATLADDGLPIGRYRPVFTEDSLYRAFQIGILAETPADVVVAMPGCFQYGYLLFQHTPDSLVSTFCNLG